MRLSPTALLLLVLSLIIPFSALCAIAPAQMLSILPLPSCCGQETSNRSARHESIPLRTDCAACTPKSLLAESLKVGADVSPTLVPAILSDRIELCGWDGDVASLSSSDASTVSGPAPPTLVNLHTMLTC